jgi:hypothetical protein
MKNKQITMLARQLLFSSRSPSSSGKFSRTTTQRYCHLSFDSLAVLEIVSVCVYSCDNAEYKLNFSLYGKLYGRSGGKGKFRVGL